MNKATKITILVVIVVATVGALAFYALKPKSTALQDSNLQPVKVGAQNKQAPQSPSELDQIPALPKDNKQAIDSEIKGIDSSLQGVENSLSTDSQDGELGL